jgi:hypothetical protein
VRGDEEGREGGRETERVRVRERERARARARARAREREAEGQSTTVKWKGENEQTYRSSYLLLPFATLFSGKCVAFI